MKRGRPPLVGALVCVEAVLIWLAIRNADRQVPTLRLEALALLVFLAVLLTLRRTRAEGRAVTALVLGIGAIFQIAALLAPPATSDDSYRYVWDAKVQMSGTDPYRFAPSDPALLHLRDDYLFPSGQPCEFHQIAGDACTKLNRPNVHTIYPPISEAAYVVIRSATFAQGGVLPFQIAGGLGALAIGFLLLRRARARAEPVWPVLLWTWCPIVAIECTNNAHIDWLAVLFTVLALTSLPGSKRAAIAIALAVAAKLFPAVVLPAMGRVRPIRLGATVLLVGALSYLPHVLTVGTKVIGYLPQYLQEEKYSSGGRFLLLDLFLPTDWTTLAAFVTMAAVAGWALWATVWRADPVSAQLAALVLVGAAMLVSTSSYPWYTLLLLALAAMNRRPEWLGVVIAPTFFYLLDNVYSPATIGTVSYVTGAVILVGGIVLRRTSRLTGPDDRSAVARVSA
jgi:alpha-1,2-mannosyltransferase